PRSCRYRLALFDRWTLFSSLRKILKRRERGERPQSSLRCFILKICTRDAVMLPGVPSHPHVTACVCPIPNPSIKSDVCCPQRQAASKDPARIHGDPGSGIIMKIHEYQAKAILKKYGVAVPRGEMAETREEAESVAKNLFSAGATGVVVKAQIHAGGRGKGGGVKIAKSVQEAGDLAAKMLGMTLITHQTGPEGRTVRRLLIEETLPIEKELYIGILVDRGEGKAVFMASVAGGMDIEQVAAENPDAILKEYIAPGMGLQAFQARKLAFQLGIKPQLVSQAVQFMTGLFKAFEGTDG